MNAIKKLFPTLLGIIMAMQAAAFDYSYGGSTLTYVVTDGNNCSVAKQAGTSSYPNLQIPVTVTDGTKTYTVTSIADNGFQGCTLPATLALPPAITKIGTSAFAGCTALKTIYMGPNVANIGAAAFNNVELTSLFITRATAPILGSNAFNKKIANVYVQTDAAVTNYTANWASAATSVSKMGVVTPTLRVGVYSGTGYSISSGTAGPLDMGISMDSSEPTTTYYATITSANVNTQGIPAVFWSSSNLNVAEVAQDGTVKLKKKPTASESAVITLTTLYSNSPTFKFNVYAEELKQKTTDGVELRYRITGTNTCAVTKLTRPAYPVTSAATTLTIPASVTINGKSYDVTRIDDFAFAMCSHITSVTMGNKITSVGAHSFISCSKLATLKFSPVLESIGWEAFNGIAVTELEFPSTISNLGGNNFQGCKSLRSINFANSVKLTSIGGNFDGCSSLTSVKLPNALQSIGWGTFKNCGLTEIILPPSVTTIARNAFYGCTKLQRAYIGPGLTTEIAQDAFFNVGTAKGADGNPVGFELYITAQTAPALNSNGVFTGANISKIYLHTANSDDQSKQTIINEYLTKWSGVATSDNLSVITGAPTISAGPSNDAKVKFTVSGRQPMKMPLWYDKNTTASTVYYGTASPAKIPYLFWQSSHPQYVYVDQEGKITVIAKPATTDKVTVTAKSLYDSNAPYVEYSVMFEDFSSGGLLYRIIDETSKTCAVTRPADRNITTVSIPETVNGYKVVQVDDYSFDRCPAITDVTIGNNVTKIGKSAFYLCSKIAHLTLSQSLKSIGWEAFHRVGITELVLPASITELGANNFQNCPNLTTVIFPNTLKTMGGNFDGCSNLVNVKLPASLQSIGWGTFKDCGLTEIIVPPSVTTIAKNAFYGCTKLQRAYIGSGLTTEIAQDAFFNVGTAKGADGTPVGFELYITAQTAPALNSNGVFTGANISKIYLHTANSDDQSKQTIINEYLTKWSGVATSDNLSVITGTPILYVGLNKDNTIYMSNAGGPALTMPLDEKDSKGIKYYAWATPSNIPHVFWSSSKPESVYVDQDGIVTFKQKPASGEKVTVTVKSMYDSNAIYGEYTVVFDDFAFEGLKYRILDEANCAVTRPADRNITAVSIPEETDNGYKVVQIDNNAFQGCTAIKNAVISSSVNNVGKFAFDHCTGMTNLTLNEGLASIQWGAFISVGITKLVVPSTVTTFAGNNFQNCPNLQSVILPNTLTSLGGNFHGCAKLSDVLLPTSLKTIGTGTFRGCGLTEIALPPNVTTLGSNAFYGCKNLERVYMGPKVTQIGVNAFSGNDNLTEIYITSQTAPTLVNNNAFNFKTSPTLYVQGQSTISKYSAWQNNFAAIRAMVDTHEDVEIRVGTISKTTMRADSNTGKENFSTESHIYALAGDNFSRSATTVLKDSDTQASIPHTFWSSTDPGKVYVDNTGAITVKNNIEMAQPVTLNLQTLYDNGPTHTIIVENYHMTGVEEILGDDADGYGLQWNEPAQIFTLSGLSAGYSLNNLSPGIYIVKQGGEAFKITVR